MSKNIKTNNTKHKQTNIQLKCVNFNIEEGRNIEHE